MCNSQLACLPPVCGFPVQLNCGLPLWWDFVPLRLRFLPVQPWNNHKKNKILASRSFQSIFAVAYVVILSRIKLYQSQIGSRKNLTILNGFLLCQSTVWQEFKIQIGQVFRDVLTSWRWFSFSRNNYSKTSICISDHTYKANVPSKTWISLNYLSRQPRSQGPLLRGVE